MRTIDDYIDLALTRSGAPSERQLSFQFGKAGNLVSQWRTKRMWPSDETMVRLAILAGIDPAEALLELNMWRSEGTAKTLYQSMARKLGTAAAIAVLIGGLNLLPHPAGAAQGSADLAPAPGSRVTPTVYIMKNIRRAWHRIRRGVRAAVADRPDLLPPSLTARPA